MPIYEYKCLRCGMTFEKIQRIGDEGESLACPYCGAKRPERVLSTFSCKGSDSKSSCGTPGSTRFS